MAKTQTKEVAVIDFEKFSVAQLPELQGKKEEIKGIIEANPVVDVVDNSTYELAKKSRTAVKSLCTGLEGEQKTVKKRIKEFVLDAVDKEYDTLVLGARSALKERQEPITIWEDKKEQERLEKVRLEELRVKQIKEAIQTFKDAWIDNVNHLLFEGIAGFNEMFDAYSAKFDRSKLAEFEVLFDDAISVIRQLADSKIKTLREQEQIRVDNLLIKEKNAENTKISNFSHEWNSNIDSLKTSDIEDVKETFKRAKIMGLKHFQSNFDEVYSALEKRLNSQIEFISFQEKQRLEQEEIAEKQRIAQEKFQKEKAEFEAKQLEAKYQERKKFLVDEDYWRIYLLAECGEREDVAKAKLLNFSDLDFEDFKLAVIKSKELVVAINKTNQVANDIEDKMSKDETAPFPTEVRGIFTNENAQEQIRVHDEEDVHEVAAAKPIEKQSVFDVSKIENQIWNNIYDEWNLVSDKYPDAFEYLKEFYHSPKKKD